jgi:hypothetical protein
MANVRKKISELTALSSASLDTTIVGVDNGTTYKIELDTLADAVTSRVNILDRNRLSSLESVTSSFEIKGRSVVSSSAQISAFGFISSSHTDITSLNSFTQSQEILNTAFTNGISARLQTSSFNDFSTSVDSRIIAATNEQSLTHLVITSSFNEYTASISTGSLINRLNVIESVSGSWITESETGSFLTSLNGTISSSAQITTLGFVSGSYETTGRGIVSGSSQLTTSFPSKTTGNWTVPAGASTQSFSVESGASYTMWVNGNIPNGIITWNATVTTSNTNVPVVGFQYGWYYTAGNALVLTSMPDQITGTNGSIVTTPASYVPNTSNVFKFGITNNSGTSQTINYGYIKLS